MNDNQKNISEKQENSLDEIIKNNNNAQIKIDDLKKAEDFIECILEIYKTKMEASSKEKNLILKYKEISFKKDYLENYLTQVQSFSELNENKKFDLIIDLLNFYNSEKNKNINEKEILTKLFNEYLNEKGELILLCDYNYLNKIGNDLKNILGEDNKLKILMKIYVISKVPFLALFTIKKLYLTKEKIDILNEKILAYEIYEDLTLTKPISYTLIQMPKAIDYMYKMYQYQNYLKILYPGKTYHINIKETFWSDNISFLMIIVDSDNEELIKQNNCAAIVIGQSHLNNFISLNKEANLSLCKQCKVSRLIIIRPSPFDLYTVTNIRDRISSYIMLFKFEKCMQKSIPIMLMNDENENVDKVYIDNKYLIREVKQKDNILRQLLYLQNPHEVQSEIKIMLTSKSKSKNKNNENKYKALNTIERYASKNLVECFDDSYLSMFYAQVALSGIFFLNFEKYPENKKKILVLGAGVGGINYFMDKILKSNVEIDAVEIDQKVIELGRDYFGLNDYKKEKNKNDNPIKWYFQDAKNFIEEKDVENHYDLIIMNIHNTSPKKERSVPNAIFEEKIIKKINKMLKNDEGIYIMYLMCKNSVIYNNSSDKIKNNFKQILLVENNDELNKIHFCFKSKVGKNELLKNYFLNIKNLAEKKDIADIKLIEKSSIHLINKFIEINNN
jgi:hypothetical protein